MDLKYLLYTIVTFIFIIYFLSNKKKKKVKINNNRIYNQNLPELTYSIANEYINSKNINTLEYLKLKNEIKNRILNTFASGQSKEIWNTSILLAQLDNLEFNSFELKYMTNIVFDLPQKNYENLYDDYRLMVKLTLEITSNFIEGNKCKCNFYHRKAKLFSPNTEIKLGFIKKASKEDYVNKEQWYWVEFYECNFCNKTLGYRTQEGGHSPHTSWYHVIDTN